MHTANRRRMDSDPLEGAGPFQFEAPELVSGEAWTLRFQDRKRNGQKGGYRKHLPFDSIQVTNQDSSNAVMASYNGNFEQYVVPNAVETFDKAGVIRMSIENVGGSTIAAGDVRVEAVKDPYDADKRARESARQGPISRVVEHFTGLPVGGP